MLSHKLVVSLALFIAFSAMMIPMLSDENDAAVTANVDGSGTMSDPFTRANGSFDDFDSGTYYFEEGSVVNLLQNSAIGIVSCTSGMGLELTTSKTGQNDQDTLWQLFGTVSIGSLSYTVTDVETSEMKSVTFISVGTGLSIDSVGSTEATVGYEYEYEVQTTPSEAEISISGVDWLSVSGHTIFGTPTESRSFTLEITAILEGYESATETVVIMVSEEQPVEGAPQILDFGYTIDPSNPYRVTFEVMEEDASRVIIDFGDGTSGSGTKVTHTYGSSGSYSVRAVASNANGSVSESLSLLIADRTPDTSVQYNHQYTFTLGIETSGAEPVVSGCPFLDVTVGSNYVTVSGIPSSTAYVGQTYNVTLTVGQFTMSWSLTVTEGSTVPVAGFTVETDGLTVIVTSTATNADMTFYQWTSGGSFVQSNSGVTRHTYAEPGTYTITQRVTSTVDGQTITDEYHTTVEVSLSDPGPAPAESDPVPFVGLAMVAIGIIVLAAGAYVRNYYVIALAAVVAVIGAILWYI